MVWGLDKQPWAMRNQLVPFLEVQFLTSNLSLNWFGVFHVRFQQVLSCLIYFTYIFFSFIIVRKKTSIPHSIKPSLLSQAWSSWRAFAQLGKATWCSLAVRNSMATDSTVHGVWWWWWASDFIYGMAICTSSPFGSLKYLKCILFLIRTFTKKHVWRLRNKHNLRFNLWLTRDFLSCWLILRNLSTTGNTSFRIFLDTLQRNQQPPRFRWLYMVTS